MSHTFRPRKGGDGQGQRRHRQRPRGEGMPKFDMQSDLDQLPELDYNKLDQMETADLAKLAKKHKIELSSDRSKVLEALLVAMNEEFGAIYSRGILETMQDGWGFLRRENYSPSPQDIYVSQSQIKRFGLRTGDMIFGQVRQPKEGEKYQGMLRVESCNGYATQAPEMQRRRNFDELTPLHPENRIMMETNPENILARVIDLISPIGKGQRCVIVSPPKAGKTTILKTIANSVTANNPDIYLMVLLVDERPEEVTDFRRSVKGQVISSTFDEPAENHMRVAELCLEQAKRLVESGRDVVVLLDSLTRYSRASNLTINPSGRTLSGGLDPSALYRPRRFFGSARNIEEGGSLTVIATALIDTGSKMDDAIFEEFKGTGNSEIVLDRDLAERRIWPAIDVRRSSTRHEEKLFHKDELEGVIQLHRLLANQQNAWEATENLIKLLKRSPNNQAFLDGVVQRLKPTA